MTHRTLHTARLELRPGTPGTYSIPPADRAALAADLGVTVPESWPVEHYDEQSALHSRDSDMPMRFVILRDSNTLIGILGGSLVDPATMIIGYSIAPEHQGRGYASEAVRALVEDAFRTPGVSRIVAETYPELTPSIRVLEKNGFRLTGPGSEERVIRYELQKGE